MPKRNFRMKKNLSLRDHGKSGTPDSGSVKIMKSRCLIFNNGWLSVFGVLFISQMVCADSSVQGGVDISTDVGNVRSAAVGGASKSIIDVATIGSSDIGGSAELNVQQKDIVGVAIGHNSVSEISVGTVENSGTGKVVINVLTGRVLSMTAGSNKEASTKIGTVSDATTGLVDLNVSTGNIINVNGKVSIGSIGGKE